MDVMVVVLIVCLAAGYLISRYVKTTGNGGGCGCENRKCPLSASDPGSMENFCDEMNCDTAECEKASLRSERADT